MRVCVFVCFWFFWGAHGFDQKKKRKKRKKAKSVFVFVFLFLCGRVGGEDSYFETLSPFPSQLNKREAITLCVKNNTKKARKRLLLRKKNQWNVSFVCFQVFFLSSQLPCSTRTLPPRRSSKIRRHPDHRLPPSRHGALHLEADPELRRGLDEVGQESRTR